MNININLTLDDNYFHIPSQFVGMARAHVFLDWKEYDYFYHKDDADKIIALSESPTWDMFGGRSSGHLSVISDARVYRITKDTSHAFTNIAEEMDVEVLKTGNNGKTGVFAATYSYWAWGKRPALQVDETIISSASQTYICLRQLDAKERNKQGFSRLTHLPLIKQIFDKAEVLERLSVPVDYINLVVRDDLSHVKSEVGQVWSRSGRSKTSLYIFLDGDNVEVNDLDTLLRNPRFNTDTTPWLLVLDTGHGNTVLNFNLKVYESQSKLLKDILPNFEQVTWTKDQLIEMGKVLTNTDRYSKVTKELADKYLPDIPPHTPTMISLDDDKIIYIGNVESGNLDNIILQGLISHLTEEEKADLPHNVRANIESYMDLGY